MAQRRHAGLARRRFPAPDVFRIELPERAAAGALIFGRQLFMTAEMWSLGIAMSPLRLVLFLLLMFPVLTVLAYYAGVEESVDWRQAALDACVAYAVAFIVSAAGLVLLGIIDLESSHAAIVGKVSLQAIPASIGAMLARSQLGMQEEEGREERRRETYGGELFLAAIGALFMAFNIAPTEEVVQIASMVTAWQGLALMAVSMMVMHAFVYALAFRGQHPMADDNGAWSEFFRLTVAGYALTLLICLFVLWAFGRSDGLAPGELLMQAVVLAFPGAIGAAAARLIL
jgi:putative integral membrane protein (TIGR02587 family)